MLVLTVVTAVQRFVKVWRQASATVPAARPPPGSGPGARPQPHRGPPHRGRVTARCASPRRSGCWRERASRARDDA